MDEIRARIKELAEQIADLGREQTELRNSLALMVSPFKVGDRVTFHRANGVYELTDIRAGNYGREVAYHGTKIKKNGEPSAKRRELWEANHSGGLSLVADPDQTY